MGEEKGDITYTCIRDHYCSNASDSDRSNRMGYGIMRRIRDDRKPTNIPQTASPISHLVNKISGSTTIKITKIEMGGIANCVTSDITWTLKLGEEGLLHKRGK